MKKGILILFFVTFLLTIYITSIKSSSDEKEISIKEK